MSCSVGVTESISELSSLQYFDFPIIRFLFSLTQPTFEPAWSAQPRRWPRPPLCPGDDPAGPLEDVQPGPGTGTRHFRKPRQSGRRPQDAQHPRLPAQPTRTPERGRRPLAAGPAGQGTQPPDGLTDPGQSKGRHGGSRGRHGSIHSR